MRTNNFSKVAGLRKLAAIHLWGKACGSAVSLLEPCQPPAPLPCWDREVLTLQRVGNGTVSYCVQGW